MINKFLFVLITLVFLSCNINGAQQSNRKLINSKAQLILSKDTLATAKSFLKVKIGEDSVAIASVFVSKRKCDFIVNDLLVNFNYSTIIATDFCVEYKEQNNNWLIDKADIKNVGVYYVDNDSLKFDFHDLKANRLLTFSNLSGAYCDASIVLLMEETQIKMPALFGIRLKKKDLPKESDVIKSKKSEDVLYKRWRDFYEKHN